MSERMKTSQRVLSALSAGFSAAGAALRSDTKHPSNTAEPEDWMRELFAPMTTAGVKVTEGTAMRLAAHFACVNLVSRTLGSFPIHVPQHNEHRVPQAVQKRRARAHGHQRIHAALVG